MVVCHLLLQADGEGPYPHLSRRLLRHTDVGHPGLIGLRHGELALQVVGRHDSRLMERIDLSEAEPDDLPF